MQGDSESLGVTKSINNSIAKKMKKVEGRAALGPKTAARRFRLDTGKALDLNAVQIFASAARAGSLSAVSYTHLDVYKRQTCCLVQLSSG